MGWRHWKAFYADISQEIMESMMDEMVKKYPVDGVPTSLQELGYLYVVSRRPSPLQGEPGAEGGQGRRGAGAGAGVRQ